MLSFDDCEKILNAKGQDYSKEEVESLRNFLYQLGEIEYGIFVKFFVR